MWLLRLLSSVLFIFFFLKVCESWLFDQGSWLTKAQIDGDAKDDDFDNLSLHDPIIKTHRCDACRLLASRFDAGFELAELNLEGKREELTETEVEQIVTRICMKRSFQPLRPIIWDGYQRLAAPGIETWLRYQRVGQIVDEEESLTVDWAQRLKNHCRFLAEKLKGIEIYDMWLRTSANSPEGFEQFLCFGEGIYGDCTKWLDNKEKWPAGEDVPEGDEEEEDDIDDFDTPDYLKSLAQTWEQDGSANSAPKM